MDQKINYPAPRDLGCPWEPSPTYKDLLSHDPVATEQPLAKVRLWNGTEPWLVVGYDMGCDILRDSRFSVNPVTDGYPHITSGLEGYRLSALDSFINKDNPEHNLERRMYTKWFTVKRIEGMRPQIQRIVDSVLDNFIESGQPTDLYEGFSLPIPSLVIFELLNAPYSEHERVQRETSIMLSWQSGIEESSGASARLLEFCLELIEERSRNLQDDVLSAAIAEYYQTGRCTLEQLAQGVRQLFLAGHETTANAMTLCAFLLLSNPGHLAEFTSNDDPEFIANAVDEMQRYITLDQSGRARVALEDVYIRGNLIRAGEGVIVSLETMNRDSRIFEGPSELDFNRSNSGAHAAYGQGIHRCLGERLAQVELQIGLTSLFRRLPDLQMLTALNELEFKTDHTVYGMRGLPVTWGSSTI